jgi:hypothetical protein
MRCFRLLVRGSAVTEAAPFGRSHLEETEVLTILRVHVQVRLAPRDADRLAAVVAEDMADRLTRRRLLQCLQAACHLFAANPYAKSGSMTRVPRQARAMEAKLASCRRADLRVTQQPGVALEEPDHLLVLAHRPHVTLERLRRRLRLCGSAAGDDHQGANTHHQGFQTMTS